MAGALEVRKFQVTCPPATTQADPQTSSISMPVRTVRSIRVRVPPGPSGVMGFLLAMASQPVIPTQANTYLIADNEIFEWDNQDWPESGAWQVQMYNTGIFAHTIYLTFVVEVPDTPTAGATSISLDIGSLSSPATVAPVTVDDSLPAAPELT